MSTATLLRTPRSTSLCEGGKRRSCSQSSTIASPPALATFSKEEGPCADDAVPLAVLGPSYGRYDGEILRAGNTLEQLRTVTRKDARRGADGLVEQFVQTAALEGEPAEVDHLLLCLEMAQSAPLRPRRRALMSTVRLTYISARIPSPGARGACQRRPGTPCVLRRAHRLRPRSSRRQARRADAVPPTHAAHRA